MRCEQHPDADAVGRCVYCGRGVCSICKISYEHAIHCKECIEAGRIRRPGGPPVQQPVAQPYPAHPYPAVPPVYPMPYYPIRAGAYWGSVICLIAGILLCFGFSFFFLAINSYYDEVLMLLVTLWVIEGTFGIIALAMLAQGKEAGRKLGIIVAIIGLPLGVGPGTLVSIVALAYLLSYDLKRYLQWRTGEIARLTGEPVKGTGANGQSSVTGKTVTERADGPKMGPY